MADISAEIQAFRDAVYGEEVRGSMISALEKVNADGEEALAEVAVQVVRIDGIAAEATQTLDNANTAIDTANEAITEAQDTLAEGVQQVQQAAENALLSESWARGGTGIRTGEESDSSRFYSLQSQTEANRAKTEADRAETYAGFVVPTFLVDFLTGNLTYSTTDDITFVINMLSGNLEYSLI